MIVASVHVSGVNARTTECSRITAGLVGAKIEIDYQDSVWGPLTKTVVFWGAAVKDVVTNDNVVTIPAEVVATYGKRLRVGVYGVDGSGALVIPTIWADLGEICAAADPSGDETTDPSSPVWAQVAALAEASARAAAGSANDAAASAAQAEAAAGSVNGAVETAGVILRDTQAAARQAGTYVEEAAAVARDAAAQAESADYSAQDAAQAAQVARNAATAAGAAADSVHADASAAAKSAEQAAEAASDAVRSAEAAASGAAGAQNAASAAQGYAASAASSAQAAEAAAASVPQSIEEALAEAKASGEFNGPKGDPYELTDDDKSEIVEQVTKPVESSAAAAALSAQNSAASANASQIHSGHAAEYRADANAAASRAADAAAAAQTQQQQAAASAAAAAASAAEAKEAADSAAIVPKPTAAVAGKALIVNTAGTGYEFGNAPGGGGSGEPAVPSDWNAAEGQPGHILNRTHWVEENGILEVLPECQFETEYESVSIAGEVPIAIGAEYTVHWNGVDYACIAKSVDIEGVVVPGLGNLAAFGIGEETTDPFVIIALPIALTGGVGAQVNILDGSTELTVSITTVGEVIHKLDEKFLPMDKLRDVVVFEFDDYPEHMTNIPQYAQIEAALESGKDVILSFKGEWFHSCGIGPADLYFARAYEGSINSLGISRNTGLVTYSPKPIPDDYYINRLIGEKSVPIPATAKVGQTIKVSAVNEAGKPTAWEAVDFPSGGGGADEVWETIIDYTVPADTAVGPIDFTVDKNGNEFDLKKCAIFLVVIPPAGFSEKREIKCCFDKNYPNSYHWGYPFYIGMTQNSDNKAAYFTYIECVGPTYIGYGSQPQNTTSLAYGCHQWRYTFNFDANTGLLNNAVAGDKAVINAFRIGSLPTDFLGAGSTIKIMGVRK